MRFPLVIIAAALWITSAQAAQDPDTALPGRMLPLPPRNGKFLPLQSRGRFFPLPQARVAAAKRMPKPQEITPDDAQKVLEAEDVPKPVAGAAPMTREQAQQILLLFSDSE